MKRRIVVGIIAVVLSVGLFGGCQKAEETTNSKEENFSVVGKMRAQVKNEGIFYIDGYTELMKFYDFNLGQSIPICDRPNCEHNSAKCNAYLPQGSMSGMGCYRDKLYYYDNMSPGVPFYQCDKNGSNRKEIAKLNEAGKYGNLSVLLPMFFTGDEVYLGLGYFNLLTEPITKENGTIEDQEHFWMIGKINLVSGKFEIVKDPKVFESSMEYVDILDCIGDKIFYSHNLGKDEVKHYVYDLKTQTEEQIFETSESDIFYVGSMHEMDKEIYLNSNTSSVYMVDVQTKEEELVIQKEVETGKEIDWFMSGENLIYCVHDEGKGTDSGEEFGEYSLKTNKERELTEEEFRYAPFIAATEEWYVGMTEEGTICIPKKEYEQKDWSKVQIIGSF